MSATLFYLSLGRAGRRLTGEIPENLWVGVFDPKVVVGNSPPWEVGPEPLPISIFRGRN